MRTLDLGLPHPLAYGGSWPTWLSLGLWGPLPGGAFHPHPSSSQAGSALCIGGGELRHPCWDLEAPLSLLNHSQWAAEEGEGGERIRRQKG